MLASDQPPLLAARQALAARYGVVADIHQQDFIWHFIRTHPSFASEEAALTYYFSDGARSAQQLAAVLGEWYAEPTPYALLEFAAGYGCVTRHLAGALPHARVTACDIHPAAVTFLRETLDTPAVLSHTVPEAAVLGGPYAVVFALSFFSHMPRATWTRWLHALVAAGAPGGLLVFTTHGWASRVHLGEPRLPLDGFWFQATSEQQDLDTADYGSTIVTPAFVVQQVAPLAPAVRLVAFREAAWWGHQDLYILRRA